MAISYLLDRGLNLQGIFRYKGNLRRILQVIEEIDQGYDYTFNDENPYDVAQVLKVRYSSPSMLESILSHAKILSGI